MVANDAIERLLGYSIRKRVQDGETSCQIWGKSFIAPAI
jgi:hypothetical protein